MKRQWRDRFVGFMAGIFCILAVGLFVHGMKTEEKSEDNSQERLGAAITEQKRNLKNQKEVMCQEDSEAEEKYEPRGFRVTEHMEISQSFIEELMLYQYIEYGVRKYNQDTGKNEQYSLDIERDMLPYDTVFTMKEADDKPYKTDLAKEMIPELSGNLYNFILHSQSEDRYISIDTYNMKIYLYDSICND